MNADFEDIPSPLDFHDPMQARAWVADTVVKRPWRPRFFEAFAQALRDAAPIAAPTMVRVAELGSGPGHLALALLQRCPQIAEYLALDFSAAMHDLARTHLDSHAARVEFIQRDFRDAMWTANLAPLDAVVTMQAAHELRHRARLPALLREIHSILAPGGMLLYCDHYEEPGPKANGLYWPRTQQAEQLSAAGFGKVALLHDEGGMALYRAERGR